MAASNRNEPKRCKTSESQYSVMEFMRDFPDDATCLGYLWRRHLSADGEHADCPKCEKRRRFHRVASRPSYSCDTCGHHLHPTAGTIMHKSSTSLHLWFYAIFLMAQTRCGLSAKQLERELGVTYKTAWRMFHLIRNELMKQDDDGSRLSGNVEMDEMYVGGKPRLKDRAMWLNAGRYHRKALAKKWVDGKKVPVFGMVERGGEVRAYVVPNTKSETLGSHVATHVLPASSIFTDEAKQYIGIAEEGAHVHHRIHHTQGIYVRGDVHTNTIEGFWALVKTGIGGAHHAVSARFLQG